MMFLPMALLVMLSVAVSIRKSRPTIRFTRPATLAIFSLTLLAKLM
jgi:hypothetical protein